MKYFLFFLFLFLSVSQVHAQDLLCQKRDNLIDSSMNQCCSGLVPVSLPFIITPESHPQLCSVIYEKCDVKCVSPERMSQNYRGKEFDYINSSFEQCQSGHVAQKLINPTNSIKNQSCNSSTGICDAQCISQDRIERKIARENRLASLLLFHVAGVVIWIVWFMVIWSLVWRMWFDTFVKQTGSTSSREFIPWWIEVRVGLIIAVLTLNRKKISTILSPLKEHVNYRMLKMNLKLWFVATIILIIMNIVINS